MTLKGVNMSCEIDMPQSFDELKCLPFAERGRLWAKYSQHPFKRQLRSLWYYIQCDRLNLRIEHKHLVQIRKYKDNPDKCLTSVPKKQIQYCSRHNSNTIFQGHKIYNIGQ